MKREIESGLVDRVTADIGFRLLAIIHFTLAMLLVVGSIAWSAWIRLSKASLSDAWVALERLQPRGVAGWTDAALGLALVLILVFLQRVVWPREPWGILESLGAQERLAGGWLGFHARGIVWLTGLSLAFALAITLIIGLDGNFSGSSISTPLRPAGGLFVLAFVPGSMALALLTILQTWGRR